MLMKPFLTAFSNVGNEVFLRCDPKYRHFWDNMKGVSVSLTSFDNKKLKDVMLPFEKTILGKGELDESRPILELDDVEPRTSITQKRITNSLGSSKLDFADCTLVFARLRPYLGKVVTNDPKKKYLGTTEWIPLKIDKKQIRPLFLKYLLLSPDFLKSYNYLLYGKEHPRIQHVDLVNMFIPSLPVIQQIKIEKIISPLEKRIISLHESLTDPIDMIDETFSQKFGYNIKEYGKRSSENIFQKSLIDFASSPTMRCSTKFNHPKYDYVSEILDKFKVVKLNTLCSIPVDRGVQPEYTENGEILVVKTINLKHGYLDFTEAEYVSKKFFDEKKQAEIKKNDILVSSTGEGRGKIDIYDLDRIAIADSHIAIIRLSNKINKNYVLYFMRSLLGKLQLETLEMAIKATPEIYPDQLGKMIIPILKRTQQKQIVNIIRNKLKKIEKQRLKVKQLRDQIDNELCGLLHPTQ